MNHVRTFANDLNGLVDQRVVSKLNLIFERIYQLEDGQASVPVITKQAVVSQLKLIGLLGPLGQNLIGSNASPDPQLQNLPTGNGTVTSLTAGTGITLSPNPIVAAGTITLANTAVTPGSYTSADITVDAQGRITAAANGIGSGGTVTSVSVVTANGVSGSVANPTTTPAITLTLGAITPTSVNGLTITTSTGTLTIANSKTVTVNNTLTLAGTDLTTMTFPTTSATIARIDTGQTFTGSNIFSGSASNVLTVSSSAADQFAAVIQHTGTSTHNFGLEVIAGTGSSDYSLLVRDSTASSNWLLVKGDGSVQMQKFGAGTATFDASGNISSTAVVPFAAPSAGQILVGNAGGTAYAAVSMSGDATLASTGALTLASVITAGGPTGSATVAPIITYDAKGRLTAVSSATITPAVGSITGLGTGVATALAVNVGSAGAFITFNGNAGTPSALVGTNITGTASSLTAGTATNATNTAITDDTTTNATMFPTWVTTASGNQAQKVSSTKLTFNPSTGNLVSTLHSGLTITANGTNTLNIAAGKTFVVSNSLTLAGTDSTTMTFPTTNATIARTDASNTFTGDQTFNSTNTQTILGLAASRAMFGYDGSSTIVQANSGRTVKLLAGNDTFGSGSVATLFTTGNFKIAGSALRGTTEGTNHLDIFNGTAPAGTLSNGISLYSSSGECFVMDAGGTATQISSHERATGEWIHHSFNKQKRLVIKMEQLCKFIDAHFGTSFVQESEINWQT